MVTFRPCFGVTFDPCFDPLFDPVFGSLLAPTFDHVFGSVLTLALTPPQVIMVSIVKGKSGRQSMTLRATLARPLSHLDDYPFGLKGLSLIELLGTVGGLYQRSSFGSPPRSIEEYLVSPPVVISRPLVHELAAF